jgi:hypothetical protein
MKLTTRFSTLMFTIALMCLAACEMSIPPFLPTDRPDNGEVPVVDTEAPDTTGWNIPAEAITVAEAREICAGLASGEKTTTKYYVMGYVKKLHSKHADGVANFGNAQFYMEDVKGANSSDDFMAYQVYGVNNQKITNVDAVLVGDFVIIYGPLTNYNGTYETTGQGSAHIWKSTNPLLAGEDKPAEPEELVIPEEAKAWNIPAEAIDVIKAREICMSLAAGDSTDQKYYVMGYVKNLHSKHAEGVAEYGNAQFYMENIKGKNSQNEFLAFQVYGLNGTKISDPNAVAAGDFVVVYGKLTNFMGNTYETLGKGSAHIWKSTNPLLVETKPEPVEVTLLNEDLNANFGSMNTVNVVGEQVWENPMIKAGKGQKKAPYIQMDGKNTANEDWVLTPELDLTGMSEATLTFESKFTAEVSAEHQKQYTVLVSSTGDVTKAEDWTELSILPYDATTFTPVTVAVPEAMIGKKCYIAWKYTCQETSHAWQLRTVTVKAMTKVD